MEPRARPAATRGQQPSPDTASATGKTGTRTDTEHEDHNTPNKRKHLKSLVLGMGARWPKIEDRRFGPVSMLDSGNEDDVLDALVDTLSFDEGDEWDWGAEHSEDDR